MTKLKIKIVTLGHIPHNININKVKNWKSKLFEVVQDIDSYSINHNSDGNSWEYTDAIISNHLSGQFEGDILLAITNVALESNYFLRRLGENKVCLTYYQMADILNQENIPLCNLLLRVIYATCFIYKQYSNRIPATIEHTDYAHDDTRGCLFDMNGIKTDIIYSTNKPQICPSCVERLKKRQTPINLINQVQNELSAIRKDTYFLILDFVKNHPIWALIISIVTAVFSGIVGSIIASFIYDKMK